MKSEKKKMKKTYEPYAEVRMACFGFVLFMLYLFFMYMISPDFFFVRELHHMLGSDIAYTAFPRHSKLVLSLSSLILYFRLCNSFRRGVVWC